MVWSFKKPIVEGRGAVEQHRDSSISRQGSGGPTLLLLLFEQGDIYFSIKVETTKNGTALLRIWS